MVFVITPRHIRIITRKEDHFKCNYIICICYLTIMQTRWLRYESMEINHEDAINPNNIQLFPRCGISRLHLNDLRYFTEDLLLHNVVNTLVPVLHGNLGAARLGWTSTYDTCLVRHYAVIKARHCSKLFTKYVCMLLCSIWNKIGTRVWHYSATYMELPRANETII